MAAVDGVCSASACAACAVIVTRAGEKIILEFGKFARRISQNVGRVVRVGLVPKLRALDDVRDPSPAPIAAAVRHEKLAVFVIVEAPWIAAAVREDFEFVTNRMVTPNAGAKFRAFGIRRARFADMREVENTLDPVKPAIRTP